MSASTPGELIRHTLGSTQFRFLAAGGLNTLLGLASYPLLLWSFPWLRTHYLVALSIAQIVCVLFAFALYKLTVFRTQGNLLREFAEFASFYAVNFAINWAALPLLVEVAKIPPIIAQFGFTLVMTVVSYFFHSRVTFRGEPNLPR